MQQRDDRQQGPRRPSLFTEEPAAGTEDKGILSQLDGKTAAPAKPSGGSRKAGKIAGGVLGLGVVAGGLVWAFGYSDEPEPTTARAAVQPASAAATAAATAAPAAPAAAPVLAVADPAVQPAQAAEMPLTDKTPPADAREVSAATILDGTTAEDPAHSLSRVLEGPPKPAPKDELSSAFDRPAAESNKVTSKHEHADKHGAKTHEKAAAKDKHKAEAAHKERSEKHHATQEASAAHVKKRPAHGSATPADSDVALLEALISHSRPSAKNGARKPARAAQCATDGGGEGGASASADCKPLPTAKAAG